MNWDQFKYPVCYLCLVSAVVTSWSLTQEVAGSGTVFLQKIILSLYSKNSVKIFRQNSIIRDLFKAEFQMVKIDYIKLHTSDHKLSKWFKMLFRSKYSVISIN